jgi:adenylate cyclase
MARSQLALVYTLQGKLGLAQDLAGDALDRSRRHGSASELAHAHLLGAERAVFLRQPVGLETTAAGIALAETNGLVSYLALLRVYEAALQEAWPVDRRVAAIRSALEDRERLGDRWHSAFLLGLLAEVELTSGAPARAQARLDLAFAHVAATGERYYEAELCRLRAACTTAAGGDPDEARGWLDRALAIARSQGARLWELRAARGIAELARGTAAAASAGATLGDLLATFDEGVRAPDVEEARRVLAAAGR